MCIYSYRPQIWPYGREDMWFDRASGILIKEGLIGGNDLAADFMGEIHQLSLGLLYADFCDIAFGEFGYYNQIIDECTMKPVEIAFKIGRYTRYDLPDILDMEDDYTYGGEMLAMLAAKERESVVDSLKIHWDRVEFLLGLYCTAYLPKAFDPNAFDEDDDYDEDDADEDYEPEYRTELDFKNCYWTYIEQNKKTLIDEISERDDLSRVFTWIDKGCKTIGAYE